MNELEKEKLNEKKIFKKVSFFEKLFQLRNKNSSEDTLIVFSMFGIALFMIFLIFGWKIFIEQEKTPAIFLVLSVVIKITLLIFLGAFLSINVSRFFSDYVFIKTRARDESILDLFEYLYYPKKYKYEFNKIIKNEYINSEKELTACILNGDVKADKLYMNIINKKNIQTAILKEIENTKSLDKRAEKKLKEFKEKSKDLIN